MIAARVLPCLVTGVFEKTKPFANALKSGAGKLASIMEKMMTPYSAKKTMGRYESAVIIRITTTPLPTGTRLHMRADTIDPAIVPIAVPTFAKLMSSGSTPRSTK